MEQKNLIKRHFLREELIDVLTPFYNEIQRHGFYDIQLYFADGINFIRMKQILALAFTVCISSQLFGQEPECVKDFEYVVERIQNDYPGYLDKVNSESAIELNILESTLRKKIIQYPDSCTHYLRMYTNWFNDLHLRVSVNRQPSSRGTEHKKKYQEIDSNVLSLKTDALEGIWAGYRGRIAVINKADKI